MLLLNFSTFFAQKNNHDYMQGVWDGGIHCEKYPIYCNQEFVLIHDDEILRMIFIIDLNIGHIKKVVGNYYLYKNMVKVKCG